jgi:hypothetical protein
MGRKFSSEVKDPVFKVEVLQLFLQGAEFIQL